MIKVIFYIFIFLILSNCSYKTTYSGKLLEIKNKKLRNEIESIYTKQEERVSGMAGITKDITRHYGLV